MQIKTSVRGLFLKRIEERLAQWQSVKQIRSRVYAPDELKWWYYNEHGTAARTIVPVEATRLAFPGAIGGCASRDRQSGQGIHCGRYGSGPTRNPPRQFGLPQAEREVARRNGRQRFRFISPGAGRGRIC